jgi:predicted O-linked N-acetylglucosamine transferase (SPINDLY family)
VVHKNLALAYARMGKIDLAIKHNLQAIALDPNDISAQDAFLLHSIYAENDLSDKVQDVLQMYRNAVQEVQPPYGHLNHPSKERKLKVGFVSGDINNHPVMYLLAPLLELISQEKFELFIYSNGEVYDEVSVKVKANFSKNWRFTRGVSAEVMAHLVQDDQIDILIDLSGHTAHNFLPAFAMKPAPVQVSWLGYPASTGLHTIDYVLTDDVIFPLTDTKKTTWTEKPWQLEGVAFSVYRPYLYKQERHHMPVFQPQPTPALKNGYVTFGSGTNLVRINRETVALWAEVLKQVPTAKMKLEASTSDHDILALFEAFEISSNRIEISRRNQETQYRFYNDIDIALDLYPSNGGNTTLDTLWMGVPVITLTGAEVPSRIGASIMHHLGRPEWIADDRALFVEKAVGLASDIEQLDQIRQSVRPAMQSSVLMDEQRFAQAFGQALFGMWQVWCDSPNAAVAREFAERNEALMLCADLLQQAEYPAAWDGYRSVLSRWPTCGEAMYGLGMVALLTGDANSAVTFLERAVDLLGKENVTASLQADCLAALGNALLLLDRMSEAVPYLQHSLALKDSPSVREWLNALPGTATKFH